MTLVVAGGIVRNRAWCVRAHVVVVRASFAAVRLPHREILQGVQTYLTGSNDDDTLEELQGMLPVVFDEPEEVPHRERHERYDNAHMAERRNRWAELCLERWPELTHLWVVDSDVIPEPNVLEKLLSVEADVVGARVPIGDGKTPIAMHGWRWYPEYQRSMGFRTGEEREEEGVRPATLVGGCYLINRRALDAGLRWGVHPQGEDGAIAEQCFRLNLRIWWHGGAKCRHLMKRP